MAKKTRSRRQRLPDADAKVNAMPTRGDLAARAGREEETGSDASGDDAVSLPPHLVDGFLWYLSALESARFADVCKSWAGIVSSRLADPAPHLFAFRSTTTHRRGEIVAVPLGGDAAFLRGRARATPAHRALQRMIRKADCLGATASGRLVLLAYMRRAVLFNPATGTFRRIKKGPGMPYYSTNHMPVVPLGGDSFFHAAYEEVGIWRAEDDSWTVRQVDYAMHLRMAVLSGDSVYVLDNEGFVFKFQLPTLYATKLTAPSLHDKYHTALAGAAEKGYLVEADGEVLFVWPLFTTSRVRGKRDLDPEIFASDDSGDEADDDYFFDDVTRLSGFDVYRLDRGMEEMRWVKENRLAGDVALFVSRWSSFSARASEKGCVSNCVYFVCDEGVGNTWGAFSLGERRMLFEHAIGAARYKERLWFYPSLKEPLLRKGYRSKDI